MPPGGEFRWVSDVPLGGPFFEVAGLDRKDGRLLTAEDIRARGDHWRSSVRTSRPRTGRDDGLSARRWNETGWR